jgi:hypothetical protein
MMHPASRFVMLREELKYRVDNEQAVFGAACASTRIRINDR